MLRPGPDPIIDKNKTLEASGVLFLFNGLPSISLLFFYDISIVVKLDKITRRNNPSFTVVYLFMTALFVISGPAEKTIPSSTPVIARFEDDLIAWNPERKLTWDDYRGEPDASADAAASTTTLLTVSYQFNRTGFKFNIRSGFDPSRSWGIHRTAYILSHEQGHFDLAEVYARKLYRKLSEYRYDAKTYRKDLKKIYDEVISEKEKMQNKYDDETRHSINKVRQAEWLKKIATLLEETKDDAEYQNKPYSSASTFRMISPKSSSRSANLFLSTSITNSFPSL